ncbi:MAG: hypothetical protein ACI35S_08350 [Anaeroplasma sp.]
MSKEIFIDVDRVLKLNNILEYTFNLSNVTKEENINKKIKNFEDYIKCHGLQSYGPLVISTSILGGDSPKIFIKIMKQIKNFNYSPVMPFEKKDEFKTTNCIYTRFEGNEEDASIANSKIKVYAYENDYVLDTTSYNVYLQNNNGQVIIDTFVPILGSI